MELKFWGTCGSTPGSHPKATQTMCVQVDFDHWPKDTVLTLDAGSGFYHMVDSLQGVENVHTILSHYHHDHIMGLLIGMPLQIYKEPRTIFHITSPVEDAVAGIRSPHDILKQLFVRPYLPDMEISMEDFVSAMAIPRVHEVIGVYNVDKNSNFVLSAYGSSTGISRAISDPEVDGYFINMATMRQDRVEEDSVVTAYINANHTNKCMGTQIVDLKTQKKIVYLTDHENTYTIPENLRNFCTGVDLLLMDCTYTEEQYPRCIGFGHASPSYCASLAISAGVKKLGLVHHHPAKYLPGETSAQVKEFGFENVVEFNDGDEYIV